MTVLRTTEAIVSDALSQVASTDGATVSPYVGVPVPSSGYVVSLSGHERKLARKGDTYGLAEAVRAYWTDNRAALSQGVRYLGIWRDLDTLYLDVSVIVPEKAAALDLARNQSQVAIWDIVNSKEVWT